MLYSSKFINYLYWTNKPTHILAKKFKRIQKRVTYYFNINYKYQNFFTNHLFVFRRFQYSKKFSLFFKKTKKKLRFLKFKYHSFFANLSNFFIRARLHKRAHINKLKFFLLKSLIKKNPTYSHFTLRRKIFLTTPNITRAAADLLYYSAKNIASIRQLKKPKHKAYSKKKKLWMFNVRPKSRTIFYNGHKSLIWKMRASRFAHWWTRSQGTLNEWRYDKLLAKELHVYLSYFQKQLLCVALASVYCCFLSWKQPQWFFKRNLSLLNGKVFSINAILKKGDILELPFGPGLVRFNRFHHSYYLKKVSSAKKFLYKTRQKARKKRTKTLHRCPKMIQKLPTGLQTLGKLISVDAGLKTVGILYTLPYLSHSVTGNVMVSAVLTLQNWRFRFD